MRAVLPPGVKVKTGGTDSVPNLIVNGIPLEIKWVGEGWLGQVRPMLASRRHRPDIVVARRMSAGARDALSKAGIGWVDESGAAEIAIGSVLVSRTGRPEHPREKRVRWNASVLAVAEALLCDTTPTVTTTMEATGLSTGSCTAALRALTDLGLLRAEATRGRQSARKIVDKDRLLDAYASAAAELRPRATLCAGVTWQDILVGLSRTGRVWESAGVAWAVTGTAASHVMAPLLTYLNAAEVYVGANSIAELEAVAAKAGLRPIDGGRLTLLPFPTVTARRLASKTGGLRVAPWPRVYADLRTTGVRGEEAAEHLREVIRGR